MYSHSHNFKLHGYSNSDWAGFVDDIRRTSGYCFSFAMDYSSIDVVGNQALWIRKTMIDLHMEQEECKQMFVDNQAAFSISIDMVFHGKTKHFRIKIFLLRKLLYYKTENPSADILTKALSKARFEYLRQKLGVCSSKVKEEC
ncbi:Copia protein [Glycine max]|nr:Copia protein [Glycine max]